MLVITRKTGETIVIGEGKNRIVVMVVEQSRGQCGQCRIGIEADKSILILRGELLRKEDDTDSKP